MYITVQKILSYSVKKEDHFYENGPYQVREGLKVKIKSLRRAMNGSRDGGSEVELSSVLIYLLKDSSMLFVCVAGDRESAAGLLKDFTAGGSRIIC